MVDCVDRQRGSAVEHTVRDLCQRQAGEHHNRRGLQQSTTGSLFRTRSLLSPLAAGNKSVAGTTTTILFYGPDPVARRDFPLAGSGRLVGSRRARLRRYCFSRVRSVLVRGMGSITAVVAAREFPGLTWYATTAYCPPVPPRRSSFQRSAASIKHLTISRAARPDACAAPSFRPGATSRRTEQIFRTSRVPYRAAMISASRDIPCAFPPTLHGSSRHARGSYDPSTWRALTTLGCFGAVFRQPALTRLSPPSITAARSSSDHERICTRKRCGVLVATSPRPSPAPVALLAASTSHPHRATAPLRVFLDTWR